MEKLSLDKLKNKGTAATAATIAAAGVLIGGSFDAPQDILKNDDAALAPPPIMEVMHTQEAEPEPVDDDPDSDDAADEDEQKRKGLRARVRSIILRMPLGVRACVVVPLWCVGWVLLTLGSALWSGVLSPAGSAILRWVVLALMILAALTITVKSVFPKTPLKKILNRHTLLWVLGGSTLFCVADVLVSHFYPDMPRLYDIARIAASSALLLAALIPSLKRLGKEKRRREEEERLAAEAALDEAEAEETAETPEEAQARVEREVLAMADSVSFR